MAGGSNSSEGGHVGECCGDIGSEVGFLVASVTARYHIGRDSHSGADHTNIGDDGNQFGESGERGVGFEAKGENDERIDVGSDSDGAEDNFDTLQKGQRYAGSHQSFGVDDYEVKGSDEIKNRLGKGGDDFHHDEENTCHLFVATTIWGVAEQRHRLSARLGLPPSSRWSLVLVWSATDSPRSRTGGGHRGL